MHSSLLLLPNTRALMQEFVRRILDRCVNIAKKDGSPLIGKRKRGADENAPPLSTQGEKNLGHHHVDQNQSNGGKDPVTAAAAAASTTLQQQAQVAPISKIGTESKENSSCTISSDVEANGKPISSDPASKATVSANGVLTTTSTPTTVTRLDKGEAKEDDDDNDKLEMINAQLLFKALRVPDADNPRDPIGRLFPTNETLQDLLISTSMLS